MKISKRDKRKKKKIITDMQGEIYSTFTDAPTPTSNAPQEVTDQFTKLITDIFKYLQDFFRLSFYLR